MTRPTVVRGIAELRAELAGRRVALVPTMGALHAGHLAHVERARELADVVVVSIFVNPLQFAEGEDLAKYPRDLGADLDVLAPYGVEYVFAPEVEEMYPDGAVQVRVADGAVAGMFEGRSRPGHFDGMLTVVAKLLNIVRPVVVTFGQKDAQQLFLVRRMVRDLDFEVAIEAIETVREPDGLAMSSRNRYLGPADRSAAVALSRALEAAASAGDRGVDAALAAAQGALAAEDLVTLDYLQVVDPRTFLPVDAGFHGPARAIVAAQVGPARLIDNDEIFLN